MDQVLNILTNQDQVGIYQLVTEIEVEALFEFCRTHDFQLVCLDGQTITNKSEFLQACAQAMEFPQHFGLNWDALEDCLTDLDWLPAKGYVVLYEQPELFAQSEPIEWSTTLEIFQAAIEYWQNTNVPMYVLLKPRSSIFSNLPSI
ncbi:MAG TPA: barstar family protein [Microcoleaceae cyanobacterium]|jgi:RNAse (barnase) inhibitor barstar